MPARASKVFTDNIPIMVGEAFIFKTPPSGDNWQFRTYIEKEKRQFRKSLRTTDVETAQRKAKELYAKVIGDVARGKKLFGELFTVCCKQWLDYQMERVKAKRITIGRHGTLRTQINRHIIPYVHEKYGKKAKVGAVDFDHYFNKDSVTIKPVRSDYSSDEAFAADSIVYGVPRRCSWYTAYGLTGLSETQKGRVDDFQVGANLRKSSNSNWYAVSITPRMARSSLGGFMYVRSDNGAIACSENHLDRQNGTWSDGKWFKFHDFVLETKASGRVSLPSGSSKSPDIKLPLEDAKKKCASLGFSLGTLSFSNCVSKLGNIETERTTETITQQKAKPPKNTLERLQKLKKLLDEGLINKSDYDKKNGDSERSLEMGGVVVFSTPSPLFFYPATMSLKTVRNIFSKIVGIWV